MYVDFEYFCIMLKSLLFIPDISGFTKFIQTTEVAHSQHVIAELLEVIIESNTQQLELAEIEGDALFFYKENSIPSQEKLLAQVETMYTAFYSHLGLLKKNRVCPCNACAMAPDLQLKIVLHCADLQFIEVQNNRKPFGKEVIEAHRLLKNTIDSENYALISADLANEIGLSTSYISKLFNFEEGSGVYDEKKIDYIFSKIDQSKLKLKTFAEPIKTNFKHPPKITIQKDFPISANSLLEYITNYSYRYHWVKGVDKFEYNENEVTRLGTAHVCVVNGKHLDFITVTKDGAPEELIYGELTSSPPPVDMLYQFYIITPVSKDSCTLKTETYWKARSPIKKLMLALFVKKFFKKSTEEAMDKLLQFTASEPLQNV